MPFCASCNRFRSPCSGRRWAPRRSRNPQLEPEERRAYPRRPVLRGGKLILNHGRNLLDVQVRDLSEGGCRIRTGNPALLPDRFTIRIVGLSGERPCEVRWRSEQELGVRFLNC